MAEPEMDIDRLLQDFAASPTAKQLLEEGASLACVGTETWERFDTGKMSAVEARGIRAHLLTCLACAVKLTEVRGEANVSGVACPAEALLYCHANGMIPCAGRLLEDAIAGHVQGCDRCLEIAGVLRTFAHREGTTHVGSVRLLLLGLQALTRYRQAERVRRAGTHVDDERWRSNDKEIIDAVVLDDNGEVCLDQGGLPETAQFAVVRAAVDVAGRAEIRLSRMRDDPWDPGDRPYVAEAFLMHQGNCVALPPTKLYANGSVVVSANLSENVEIERIPYDSLTVFVRPAGLS